MKDFELLIYNNPYRGCEGKCGAQRRNDLGDSEGDGCSFGVQVTTISKHVKHIFDSGELNPSTNISKMETVVIAIYYYQ